MFSNVIKKIRVALKDRHFGEVLRGSVLTFAGKVVAVVFGLVFTLIVARFYGPEAMGLLALVSAIFAIAVIPAMMGTGTSVLKIIPQQIVKHSMASAFIVYRRLLAVVLFFSILVGIVVFIGAPYIGTLYFGQGEPRHLIIVIACMIMVAAVGRLNTNTLRALNALRRFAVFQALPPLVNILVLLVAGLFVTGVFTPVYAVFVSMAVVTLLGTVAVFQIFSGREKNGKVDENAGIGKLLRLSFPMFLSGAMGTLMTQTDILMLGLFLSVSDVGIYSIAVKLAMLNGFILSSVNVVVASKYARLHAAENQRHLMRQVARQTSKMIFWATLPIAIVLVVFGANILALFGDVFPAGYPTLLVLVIGQFFNAISGSVAYFLNMTGYQSLYNYIMMAAAAANIGLNLLLIPLYGILGAAIASTAVVLLWNGLCLWFIYRRFGFYFGYLPVFLRR